MARRRFRYVLLPQVATAFLAGGMLAFALSFDEIIVTIFTAGKERTLPIWFFNELFRPRDRPDHERGRGHRDRGDVDSDPAGVLPHEARR